MSDESENPREGMDLRPDGGIHLWLDGTKYRLRRPRGREFRKLREELQDHLDVINALVDDTMRWAAEIIDKPDAETGTGTESSKLLAQHSPEARAEDRRRTRAIRDQTEESLRSWYASVVSTLSVNDAEIDADDLPAWTSDTAEALAIIDHWRSRPSLSGAPE